MKYNQNPKFDFYKGEDGRRKKVKKPLPPGLSYHDERVLDKVRRKAWKYEWWVDAMCCCGIVSHPIIELVSFFSWERACIPYLP